MTIPEYNFTAMNYLNALLASPINTEPGNQYTIDALNHTMEDAATPECQARTVVINKLEATNAMIINKTTKSNCPYLGTYDPNKQCKVCKLKGHDIGEDNVCRFTGQLMAAQDFLQNIPEKAKLNYSAFVLWNDPAAIKKITTGIPGIEPDSEQAEAHMERIALSTAHSTHSHQS